MKNLSSILAIIALGLPTTSCSRAAPLHSLETPRGPIQYSLHSPETPPRRHVILAHGFLRSPETMHHLAVSFAKDGIETACIRLKRSTLSNGNHAENARDMIALRQALGWSKVTYAGFSAGGLSALLAASEDKACAKALLLDPVDHGRLGMKAAPGVHVPVLAILGQAGPGNAQRNCAAMLAAIPGCRTIEIKTATHCDFEARPSAFGHHLTGSKPDATRTAVVHAALLRECSLFLESQPTDKP